jgi:hypothetical protein
MKLTDLKVVYICPDHNTKYNQRKQHMDTLLRKIGFKDIIHHKSGTESYPSCLANAIKTILTTYLTEPILVLEDDVEFTGTDEFEYPEDTDAIYFGLSFWGGHLTKNYHCGHSIFRPYSPSQVRVINMLGGHAILFVSKQYKEAVINEMDNCIKHSLHTDIVMSRLQRNFFVLANKIPSFYQSLAFNEEQIGNKDNVELYTKIQITGELIGVKLLK